MGMKTSSLTEKEHKWKMFQSRVLRRIFWLQMEESE
jgi:hypothetical protein